MPKAEITLPKAENNSKNITIVSKPMGKPGETAIIVLQIKSLNFFQKLLLKLFF